MKKILLILTVLVTLTVTKNFAMRRGEVVSDDAATNCDTSPDGAVEFAIKYQLIFLYYIEIPLQQSKLSSLLVLKNIVFVKEAFESLDSNPQNILYINMAIAAINNAQFLICHQLEDLKDPQNTEEDRALLNRIYGKLALISDELKCELKAAYERQLSCYLIVHKNIVDILKSGER